jgi:hypothetical protein
MSALWMWEDEKAELLASACQFLRNVQKGDVYDFQIEWRADDAIIHYAKAPRLRNIRIPYEKYQAIIDEMVLEVGELLKPQ